uniref:Uncharacterized protein n=1 Tax=Solanum lycopersicum TaxID=4081 RepID=A0A3Q7GBD9_SOLLC
MPNFFVDVRQDLAYASSWPSQQVRPILKVKRAPKRAYPSFRRFSCAIANHFLGDPDSNIKNAKYFCGRPSRPCVCRRLALMARLTHFEGQMSPEASIPLISTIFQIIFWVIRFSTSKMPNVFVDVRQDLVYADGWPSHPVRPILKVKRVPKLA